jgi:hypothetical protein
VVTGFTDMHYVSTWIIFLKTDEYDPARQLVYRLAAYFLSAFQIVKEQNKPVKYRLSSLAGYKQQSSYVGRCL